MFKTFSKIFKSKIKKSKIENQKSKSGPTHFGHSIDMSKYNINRLDRVFSMRRLHRVYFIDILYHANTCEWQLTRQGVFLGLNPQIWGNETFAPKSGLIVIPQICSPTFMPKIKNILGAVPEISRNRLTD